VRPSAIRLVFQICHVSGDVTNMFCLDTHRNQLVYRTVTRIDSNVAVEADGMATQPPVDHFTDIAMVRQNQDTEEYDEVDGDIMSMPGQLPVPGHLNRDESMGFDPNAHDQDAYIQPNNALSSNVSTADHRLMYPVFHVDSTLVKFSFLVSHSKVEQSHRIHLRQSLKTGRVRVQLFVLFSREVV